MPTSNKALPMRVSMPVRFVCLLVTGLLLVACGRAGPMLRPEPGITIMKESDKPAEKAADIFIIEYVKQNHCLLVSNDTYREWKNHDPWVAQNIDFYRLTFMINDGLVILPDFE